MNTKQFLCFHQFSEKSIALLSNLGFLGFTLPPYFSRHKNLPLAVNSVKKMSNVTQSHKNVIIVHGNAEDSIISHNYL